MVFKMICAFAEMAVVTHNLIFDVTSSDNDYEFNSEWEWESGLCATSLILEHANE
jgi:hypothetical protein